ncbi:MAG: mechanosensitive ion channel family protein [Synergistaceae bacterium]|nr:mechanosensitive ion channel family protein [Synergistaceae bacterium]
MQINVEELAAKFENVTLDSLLPALLCLAGGVIAVKIIMGALTKAIGRSAIEKTLHKFILTLVRITLYFLVFMTVAGALGIEITSFVAVLSVAGLALSLSMQGVLSNLCSGVMILSVSPFKAGDYVEVDGVSGTVREIGFIYTKLSTPDNKIVFIPNSDVSSSRITNYNHENERRVDIVFSAGYDCPIESVKRAIMEAVEKFPQVFSEPAPFVRVSGYKDSVIEYSLRLWCKSEDYWNLYFDVMEAVPESYAKYGVEMSYPHINVHLNKD